MSYMLSLQNMYHFFTIIKKANFVKYVEYHRKRNVSACQSGKKVIAMTNNYSKSDSGKGSGLITIDLFDLSNVSYFWPALAWLNTRGYR